MRKEYIFLLIIIFISLLFRLWNVNWDMNYHFHPDERAIVLYTLPLQFPTSLSSFFSLQSSWNPHFFAYGSFPLYLLKILSSLLAFSNPLYAQYDGITIIGRVFSAFFDTGTVISLFFLGRKVYNSRIGIIASFFYAISVLPIQLSHFYAVDTVLTFFTTLLLYKLCVFYDNPKKKIAIGIGIILGFALATKISAVLLVISVVSSISIDFFLIFFRSPHKPNAWMYHTPKFLRKLLLDGILISVFAITTFVILEPYALIDSSAFINQSLQQSEMTKSAFTFPYTLQYVGKIRYMYELKNIFLWGLGPLLSILCFSGLIYLGIRSLRKRKLDPQEYILLSFFIVYFAVVGNFAIGFMRYMLPLYPLFTLFGAVGIDSFLVNNYKLKKYFIYLSIIGCLSLLIWPVSFVTIYTTLSTRIQATDWILSHIANGRTLAIEHWDDALPIRNSERYTIETLELYNPDTPEKWQKIQSQLQHTDYIILASNRLYTPLQKLTQCAKLPIGFCYKETAQYYHNLFDGKLGFKKIAEFSVVPTIPLINLPIDDQKADESFTVYDHPKIIIFVKK